MGTRARRTADHPVTRFLLLALAGLQALLGVVLVGFAVQLGASSLRHDHAATLPAPPAPAAPVEAAPAAGPLPLGTKEILLPGTNGQVRSFTFAADGTVWFTWSVPPMGGDRIGRLGTDGRFTAFRTPTRSANAQGITMGPDGNVWFTEPGASSVGRMTPAGKFTEFPLGSPSYPTAIVTGPDGNLWFTVPTPDGKDWIGRVTPAGTITRFPLPGPHSQPHEITVGPEGDLWFSVGGGVGRMTTKGLFTLVPAHIPVLYPEGVAAGSGRDVWFSMYDPEQVNIVGRARAGAPAAVVTDLIRLPAGAGAHGVVIAADGDAWVAEGLIQGFARITPGGQVTQYTLGRDRSPVTVRLSPDGTVWFSSTSRGGELGGFGRFTVPA